MIKLDAARAIIIHNDQLLVIRRSKPSGKKYMVTPGGRIEPGEEKIAALLRELAEETMVEIANPRLVFIEDPNSAQYGLQYVFLCDYIGGEPQLHPDSEELVYQAQGHGTYEPMWFPLSKFPSAEYPFLSERLAEEIVKGVQQGFPSEPKQWTLPPSVVK